MSGTGGPRSRPWHAIVATLAYAAVACALLWPSLFGGKVLSQADALLRFEPWASVAPSGYVPENELLLDQATGFLPWNDFVAAELRRGELPLWCPYNYAGIPLVGTYQSAVYWPLNWVYYAWPSWHTYAWMALIRLVAAGCFTFLFLRRLGLRPGAAGVGGLGFMLCGFMVAWLNHPHANVALLLPALLWGVERMAARPAWRNAALFGALFGLQLLGGHAQSAMHVGLFTAGYALWRTFIPVGGTRLARGVGVGRLALAAGVGVLLAAPQIVPFLEYLRHSQAAAVFDRPDMVAGEGVGRAVLMMVAPDCFGGPHTHDYTGPLGPNLNYNELIGGYVGRVILGLAFLQVVWLGWQSRYRGAFWFFAAAVVVAGLVAWQVEPIYAGFRAIPVLSSTKLMRFLLFVALGLCVLGAMGLDGLLSRLPTARERVALTVLTFVLVAGELLWFSHGYNPQVDVELLVPRTRVTDFLARETGPHRVLAVDNTVLKPNANVFCRIPMLSGYDSMEDRALTELLLRGTLQAPPYPFVSQIGAWNRIDAFPLFCLLGVKYLLSEAALPAPFRKVQDAELAIWENPLVMPKAFLARGVEVVEDPAARVDRMTSAGFDPAVAIVHSPSDAWRLLREDPDAARGTWSASIGPAVAPADPAVEVVRYEPREIELAVATPRRALLVVNDLWSAGWHAVVSGPGGALDVPIERVDHALRGLYVEPGSWSVVLRYDPASTTLALAAAVVALAILALLVLQRR